MNKDLAITGELGGRHFAKGLVLAWLVDACGSNLKLLETATGIPQKLLIPLLTEMMEEKTVKLDGVIFRQDTRGCAMDKVKKHCSHVSARGAKQQGWTRRLSRWLRRVARRGKA